MNAIGVVQIQQAQKADLWTISSIKDPKEKFEMNRFRANCAVESFFK